VVFDQSIFVKTALKNLLKEGAIGLALTGLMILLFLGSPRATFAVLLSIPLSALTCFVVMDAKGGSINTMLLGGLALAFSRLIDDSVVVLENIFRFMEQGVAPREAAEKGGMEVALAVREHAEAHKLIAAEYLEELIVRRELAHNFARYSPRLDSLEVLPDWARKTIEEHRRDARDPVYGRAEFDGAATHDDLWNATQKELILRGKIHGYYRMYWGKKIVEWSASAEEAHATMLWLHDRYALDGDDPNTYANILWCFGLHDRPWPEREIYGTIRSMARSGMERKTDVAAYIREIQNLESTGRERTT